MQPARGSDNTSGVRIMPNATTANTSACRSRSSATTWGSFTVVGFMTSSPRSRAVRATGDSCTWSPRPLGRSGCVTTRATSQADATASSAGTANSGLPMNTTRGFTLDTPLARARVVAGGQLAARERVQVALQELAFEERQPVGEQHAVQVIRLVLDRAREESRHHALERLAILVAPAHAHARGALHLLEDPRHGQAALLGHVLPALLVEHRVHHGEAVARAVLVRDVHHEHALGDADLVRGQPDAAVRGHGFVEVGDQGAQRVVEVAHVACALAEHGVAEDADRSNAHPLGSGVRTWAIALFANSTLVSSEMRSTARSDSMLTTVANMPLVVSTLSPFFNASIRCCSFFRSALCGRMTTK